MPTIKVKEKFQITIPNAVRKAAGLAVGDSLEAVLEGKKIILAPQTSQAPDQLEAALEAGLRDYEDGKVIGPFKDMTEYRQYKQTQPKQP